MHIAHRIPSSLATLFVAAAIAGCGGGGTDSNSPPPPAPAPAPVPAPIPAPPPSTALQTSVSAATYASGSIQDAVYARINAERAQCGFGLLAQNSHLDQSASAHGMYVKTQMDAQGAEAFLAGDVSMHAEIIGQAGFTGATIEDRVQAAGYAGIMTAESMSFAYSASTTTDDVAADALVRQALTTAYHLPVLMTRYRDVGLGVASTTNTTQASNGDSLDLLVVDVGYMAAPQLATAVATYPCDGSTGVWGTFNGETPDPAPSLGLAYPLGTPIYVEGEANSPITITTATVTGPSGQVPVKVLTTANDANNALMTNQAVIVPAVALSPDTSYSVAIAGTSAGATFTKAFTFTTGRTGQ